MAYETHLCFKCLVKECPNWQQLDGMLGPVVYCLEYQSRTAAITILILVALAVAAIIGIWLI